MFDTSIMGKINKLVKDREMKKLKNMGIVAIFTFVVLIAAGIVFHYAKEQSAESQVKAVRKKESKETIQQVEKDSQKFTQQQLAAATGLSAEQTTIDQQYEAMKQRVTWEKLGYSEQQAVVIVKRFEESQEQAKNILKELLNQQDRLLKIIVITKPQGMSVSIGTTHQETEATNEQSEELFQDKEQGTPLQNVRKLKIKIKGEKEQIDVSYKLKSDLSEKIAYENTVTNERYEGDKAKQQLLVLLEGHTIQVGSETEIEKELLAAGNKLFSVKELSFEAEIVGGDQIEFTQKDKN